MDGVVTDSDGKLVRGLTADDFDLWKDGKRQAIKGFYPAVFTAPGYKPTFAAKVMASSLAIWQKFVLAAGKYML